MTLLTPLNGFISSFFHIILPQKKDTISKELSETRIHSNFNDALPLDQERHGLFCPVLTCSDSSGMSEEKLIPGASHSYSNETKANSCTKIRCLRYVSRQTIIILFWYKHPQLVSFVSQNMCLYLLRTFQNVFANKKRKFGFVFGNAGCFSKDICFMYNSKLTQTNLQNSDDFDSLVKSTYGMCFLPDRMFIWFCFSRKQLASVADCNLSSLHIVSINEWCWFISCPWKLPTHSVCGNWYSAFEWFFNSVDL